MTGTAQPAASAAPEPGETGTAYAPGAAAAAPEPGGTEAGRDHGATAAHSTVRLTIMDLVREIGGLTAAEIADRTGQHPTTTRSHLDRLVAAGLLVKARATGGQPGRPAWRYRTSAGDPAGVPYAALARAMLQHVPHHGRGALAVAARTGNAWGRSLAAAAGRHGDPLETVVDVLKGLGLSPLRRSPDTGIAEVHLRTCPFLDLVSQNPDAVCGLHLGIIRGVLDAAGVDSDGVVLDPFAAGGACLVRLRLPSRGAARPADISKAAEPQAGTRPGGDLATEPG